MAGNRIKAGKVPLTGGNITAGRLPEFPKNLSFSFKYLENDHNKFAFSNQSADYFCKVMERLKSLCSMTEHELSANRSNALRAHPIDWDDTSEKNGFSQLNEQLQMFKPYQFSVSSNAHGRIHGFVSASVFYVIWLDPHHRLYS